MEHAEERKRSFLALRDGSSSSDSPKAEFCSTVVNDEMLEIGVGVMRMWAMKAAGWQV